MENKYQTIVEELKRALKARVVSNKGSEETKTELLEILIKITEMESK